MIQKMWKKFVNRETISYVIFGVLTTAVDWVVYTVLRINLVDYRTATVISWIAAVLFAFLVNKVFVFQSYERSPKYLLREFTSFVACRGVSGIFTLIMMMVLVDIANLNEFFSKLLVSVAVLIMNYIFSKLFIFRKEPSEER